MEWWRDIYRALREANVRQVVYVPDAGHAALINACMADSDMRAVPLTTEEEGIAMLAGAWLGGERGVILMQSSGVGNCINMLGLMKTCRFPLAAFITMRGQWHEFNSWQMPMGQGTEPVLRAMGVLVETVDSPEDVAVQSQATLHKAFVGMQAGALLLHQRLMPLKTFGKSKRQVP
ncbi:MAG: phosphonopyruvate decarboxylase [Rhodospirillaceae bacterium TMED8]|nr:phosphonopyruvate decarboxylase [Magnetovibrio sp.]OUT49026.1 MAG: phosphonopyruvate decarboxylase [Rhodospirillaceae bacterium TMED8]|tara:strand:- start:816 stop:1343 length:528 start_codon:yes stop_codon:yes gene_type:complete